MSRPRDTWRYTKEEQSQLLRVREGLLKAYRRRALAEVARIAGLPKQTIYRIWGGAKPQKRTLTALYEVLG